MKLYVTIAVFVSNRCSRSGGGSTRSDEGSGDSGCASDSRCIHI